MTMPDLLYGQYASEEMRAAHDKAAEVYRAYTVDDLLSGAVKEVNYWQARALYAEARVAALEKERSDMVQESIKHSGMMSARVLNLVLAGGDKALDALAAEADRIDAAAAADGG